METLKEKTSSKHKTININRTFDLPVEKVWDAWTKPEICKKWWGPKDYICPDCTIELKVGGKVLSSMQNKKDGKKIWSVGVFKEIIPQQRLVYTDNFSDENGKVIPVEGMPGDWSKRLIVTITLKNRNGKTEFHLQHENIPVESYDDCVQGWNESLDKLEELKE